MGMAGRNDPDSMPDRDNTVDNVGFYMLKSV